MKHVASTTVLQAVNYLHEDFSKKLIKLSADQIFGDSEIARKC